MSPNPAQMLGASFDFYTGEVADMDAIGPELNADHLGNLELTRCLIISSQCYRVLEQARLWLSGVSCASAVFACCSALSLRDIGLAVNLRSAGHAIM